MTDAPTMEAAVIDAPAPEAPATPVVPPSETNGWTRTARPNPFAQTVTEPEATPDEAPDASGEELLDALTAEPAEPEAEATPEPDAPEAEAEATPEASAEAATLARAEVERATLSAIREAVPGLGITKLDEVPEVLAQAETQFQVLDVVERASETDERVLPFIKALASGDPLHIALKAHMSDLVRDVDEADPDFAESVRRQERERITREQSQAEQAQAKSHADRVAQDVEARATDFRARIEAGEEIVPGATLDRTTLTEIASLLNPPRGGRVRADLFETLAFGLNRDAALAHAKAEGEKAGREAALRDLASGKAKAPQAGDGAATAAALDPSLSSTGARPALNTIDTTKLSSSDRIALNLATNADPGTGGWTRSRRN